MLGTTDLLPPPPQSNAGSEHLRGLETLDPATLESFGHVAVSQTIEFDIDAEFASMMANFDASADVRDPDAAPEGFGNVQMTEQQIEEEVAKFAAQLGTDAEDGNGDAVLTAADQEFLAANNMTMRKLTKDELAEVAEQEQAYKQAIEAAHRVLIQEPIRVAVQELEDEPEEDPDSTSAAKREKSTIVKARA